MTADDLPQPGGVPLDAPFPGAPYGESVRRFWRKYATFRGRASRSEFWWWWLTALAVELVLQLGGDIVTGSSIGESQLGGYLTVIWFLVAIVGNIALGARRLHDANLSGYWQLLYLVPLLGAIAVWIMCLLRPKAEGARFDQGAPAAVVQD